MKPGLLRALVGDKRTELRRLVLKALQSRDAVAVRTGDQHRAGQDGRAVHEYRAEAAVCGLAAALDALAAVGAHEVDEQRIRRNVIDDFLSV